MATCALCPDEDNQIPDEMFVEHMMLIHQQVDIRMVPIKAPPGATSEEAERWTQAIMESFGPVLHKLAVLEEKAYGSFAAGFKDGWEESLHRAVGSIDALAEEHEQPGASDMTRASAHGLRQAAGAMRHLLNDGVEDIPKVVSQNDIVTVLNGLEPVDYSELRVAVACKPADMHFDYKKQAMVEGESWFPFTQGEIVLINSEGREPFGECRHTGKWGIQFEDFQTLREAMKRRAELLGEP